MRASEITKDGQPMRASGIAKGGQPFAWGFGGCAPDLLSPFSPPKAATTALHSPDLLVLDTSTAGKSVIKYS
jgi:hypothetical protein